MQPPPTSAPSSASRTPLLQTRCTMSAEVATASLQVSNPLRLQQWRALQCEADMNRDAGPVEAGFAPDSGTSRLNGAKVRDMTWALGFLLSFGHLAS